MRLDVQKLWGNIRQKPTYFFVAVAVVFGLFLVITNPPGFGLDERAHFMRTWQLTQGTFMPTLVGADHHVGAYIPTNVTDFVAASTTDLLDNDFNAFIIRRHDADMSRYSTFFTHQFSKQLAEGPGSQQIIAAYSYSPFGYLHMAAAMKVGEVLHVPMLYTMYMARLVNLAAYILLAYLAIRIVPRFKWLMVCTALLPTALIQASFMSVDPLVNGLSFVMFAYICKFWFGRGERRSTYEISRRDLIACLAAITGLVLCKSPYIVLALPLLFLPVRRFNTLSLSYIWKAAWVMVPILAALWWVVANRLVNPSVATLNPGADIALQTQYVLHHPLRFIYVLVRTHYESFDHTLGALLARAGDRQIGLPPTMMLLFFAFSTGLSGFLGKDDKITSVEHPRAFSWLLALSALAVVSLVSLTLYITFSVVGNFHIEGVQGRYFIPVVPFLMVLFFRTVPWSLRMDKQRLLAFVQTTTVLFLATTVGLYFLANF